MHLTRWPALLCGLCLVLSSRAFGAEAVTGFYVAKAFRPLSVAKNSIVVLRGAKQETVPRASVLAKDEILGYPVTFDQAKHATGILTREIVLRSDAKDAASKIRGMPGFVALTPLTFRSGLYLASFVSPMAALNAANQLYLDRDVIYAHPNFILPKVMRDVPTSPAPVGEPYFASQWHLENTGQFGGTPGADIHARAAWDVTTGDPSVLVAVLDSGFEPTHPDMDGAWWRNAGEIPNNGIDDDGDGYVDDVAGWNFHVKSGDMTAGLYPDHGTCVAGLVAARANGKGVTGVCPKCTLIPVIISDTPADDAAAFYYADKHGASIITNSWGYAVGTPVTDVVVEAINDVAAHGRGGKGTIILFAMNNNDQDDCTGSTPDISSLDSVIAISAANDQDVKVSFSAWGKCLKLIAPTFDEGHKGITTTDLSGAGGYNNGQSKSDLSDPDYTNDFGGTSAATPIAAGVFALMLSVNPQLTRDEALSVATSTADKVHPELAGYDAKTGFSERYGYGRINAARAVQAVKVFKKYTQISQPPPSSPARRLPISL